MDKMLWLAALSLSFLLSASGCTKVESCKEGTTGCMGGACTSSHDCKFDLVCLNNDDHVGKTVCGRETSPGKYDCGSGVTCSMSSSGDGDAGTDAGSQPTCECTDPTQVCAPGTTDKCLSYCDVPKVIPGPDLVVPGACQPQPTDFNMHPTPLTFEEVCRVRCRQHCAFEKVYCGNDKCDQDCEGADVLTQCRTECPGDALPCMNTACDLVRNTTCATYVCAKGTKSCNEITCVNTGCKYNNDGSCDDGDIPNANYNACDWGGDCGDCGPRKGPKPPQRYPLASLCLDDYQCSGHSDDFTVNKAFCLTVDGLPDNVQVSRCMPDCSGEGETCPEGYNCEPITLTSTHQAYKDQNGVTGKVCNPLVCQ